MVTLKDISLKNIIVMTTDEKRKTVNLEDMQAHTRVLHNKGIGNSAVCSTAASTEAKEITLGTTFSLASGATIIVTFTNGISVGSSTLAITHTDLAGTTTTETAKSIYYKGAALPANVVSAGMALTLRYDGSVFNVIGELANAYTKAEIDSMRSPTYDPTNKRYTFPANATFEYQSANKRIILSH